MTTETLTPTTEPRTAPLEPTTPIRPSEAIRLGCLLAPVKGEGAFFPADNSACALGAMALGLGYDGPRHDGYVPDAYHIVHETLPSTLPDDFDRGIDAIDAVWHRNDGGWSRERIADWLEGLGL